MVDWGRNGNVDLVVPAIAITNLEVYEEDMQETESEVAGGPCSSKEKASVPPPAESLSQRELQETCPTA